jgi:hypothetical protein
VQSIPVTLASPKADYLAHRGEFDSLPSVVKGLRELDCAFARHFPVGICWPPPGNGKNGDAKIGKLKFSISMA